MGHMNWQKINRQRKARRSREAVGRIPVSAEPAYLGKTQDATRDRMARVKARQAEQEQRAQDLASIQVDLEDRGFRFNA